MRIIAAIASSLIALTVNAASVALPPDLETPHYYEQFDPLQKPWQPGQALNVEEVFKNYQYFEIIFLMQGEEIQVNRYIQGRKEKGERYRIKPDGALDILRQ